MPVVTPSPAHPPSMNPIWVSITRMGQLLVSLPFVTGWAGGVLTFTSEGRLTSHTLLPEFTVYVMVVQRSSAALPVSGTSDSVSTCP